MGLQQDIATLRALGPIKKRNQIIASVAMRIDFHFPAPVHERPAELDPFLARAADILGDRIKKYGGELDFAPSRGRKANAADIAQLSKLSAIMRRSFDTAAAEIALRRQHIEAQSAVTTKDEDFKPVESGSLFLGDTISLQESVNHIILRGFGDWGVSLSFGPDLWAEKHAEICALAEDIFASGIPASGTFGLALNVQDGCLAEDAERHIRPIADRFAMVNPIQPAVLTFQPGVASGVFPVGCWYVLDQDWAQSNGIDTSDLHLLEGRVHAVRRTPFGLLIKLYEMPVLGDMTGDFDPEPAKALSEFIQPAVARA